MTCTSPIMKSASHSYHSAQADPTHIHRLQAVQSRFLRNATVASWYQRNNKLHIVYSSVGSSQYLTIQEKTSRNYFDSAFHHPYFGLFSDEAVKAIIGLLQRLSVKRSIDNSSFDSTPPRPNPLIVAASNYVHRQKICPPLS